MRTQNRNIARRLARINSFLQEYISGMAVVQLFTANEKRRREFAKRIRTHAGLAGCHPWLTRCVYPAVEFLSFSTIALIYWAGGNRVLGGSLKNSACLIAFIDVLAQRFFPAGSVRRNFEREIQYFASLASRWRLRSGYSSCWMSRSRFESRADAKPATSFARAGLWKLNSGMCGFSYRNVDAAREEEIGCHRGDVLVFRMQYPGRRLRLWRTYGSLGRRLLIFAAACAFLTFSDGPLVCDSGGLGGYTGLRPILQELRKQFGIVLQDPFLFSGRSELELSGWGHRELRGRMWSRAGEEIGLGDFIRSLPQGVETVS